jgi:hypothetical protein
MLVKARSVAERFWAKVNKQGPIPEHCPELGPCWLWTASIGGSGYGQFNDNGRMWTAPRLAYVLVHGVLPESLEPDHLCRNRLCVNAAHMEPVTHRVNTLRGATVAAANVAKTHCPRGHCYDESNTAIRTTGQRKCRACDRERHRERAVRLGGWRVRTNA